MPRFLIHVGPHKTGTTYLQLTFATARQRLLEHGVLYPAEWSGLSTIPGHWQLVRHIRDGNLSLLQQQFDQIATSGAECVLISAEGLDHLQKAELEALRRIIGEHPITVLFYCRRWSDLLPSLWQERVKHGYDETFPEFFSQNLSDPFSSAAMNFTLSLDRYASVFGRDGVRIVSYSNLSDAGQDLAKHFFDTFLPSCRLVLDGLPRLANPRPNASMAAPEIEVIRALNSLRAVSGGGRDAMLRAWYLRERARFDLAEVFSAIRLNTDNLQFSDASPAVGRLQEAILAAYGDQFVAPTIRGGLFAERTSRIEFVQPRYLTDRSVHAALQQVYAAFVDDSGNAVAIH